MSFVVDRGSTLSLLIVGSLMIIFGYLIKYREYYFLINSFDSMIGVPLEIVADISGNTLLWIGLVAMIFGLVVFIGYNTFLLNILFAIFVVCAIFRMYYKYYNYLSTN